MKRGAPTLIACAAVLLAGGCGSSSSSSSASSASSSPTSTVRHGGLRASTTPKFAPPPTAAHVASGTIPIAYRNITIAPDALKVKVGTTLRWTNYDSIEHNVTSVGGPMHFESGTFGEGKTFTIKVTKPGVIHYECTIHPTSMNGTIEVVN
jgi:plastocyanin